MEHLPRLGRVLFAGCLMAFGVQQFLWGDFVPGRAPAFPAGWPGQQAFAYVTGLGLIAAGAAIALGKRAREAALATAAVIALWACLRQVPVAVADTSYGGAWTVLGKGLALTGGALAVAGYITIGRWCLGAFLISSGVQHFLFVPYVATLVPSWIPGATVWTYVSAIALIAGGIGMMVPRTAQLAATLSGAMIFIWFVILHVPRGFAAATPEASRNEWTAVVEALAMSAIAFLVSRETSWRGREVPEAI